MKFRLLTALALAAAASTAMAEAPEFEFACTANPGCNQANFEAVAADVSAALNFKNVGPAEATGITGIGVALFASYVPTENEQAWRDLTGEDVSAVGMAGIIVRKGLPFGIDLGAFYSAVPGTSVDVFGAEVRYAILEGGAATPALSLRANYVGTSGIDDFDYESWGADVSISKGFALLTPYLGAGYQNYTADPKGISTLSEADDGNERIFVGMRIGLALLDITPEYERTGDNNSYNLLIGLSF